MYGEEVIVHFFVDSHRNIVLLCWKRRFLDCYTLTEHSVGKWEGDTDLSVGLMLGITLNSQWGLLFTLSGAYTRCNTELSVGLILGVTLHSQ